MNLILQKDVKNLGKVGDLVRVKDGYGRNYLIPNGLAVMATEKKSERMENTLKKMSEIKQKKAVGHRKELLHRIADKTFTFKVSAGDNNKLFGSVTAHNVSEKLAQEGFQVDRRDILLEPIKTLGQFSATISFGDAEELQAQVILSVEKQASVRKKEA